MSQLTFNLKDAAKNEYDNDSLKNRLVEGRIENPEGSGGRLSVIVKQSSREDHSHAQGEQQPEHPAVFLVDKR